MAMSTSARLAEPRVTSSAEDSVDQGRASGFLVRQPIVDQDDAVVGYELRLEADPAAEGASGGSAGIEVRERMLLTLLGHPDMGRLTEQKLTAVFLSAPNLAHPALETLPRDMVIVVSPTRPVSSQFMANVRALATKGFRIGLDYVAPYAPDEETEDAIAETRALLDLASYVLLDVERSNAIQLSSAVRELGSRDGVRLIASNLSCLEEFEVCRSLPFAYLHGSYFALQGYSKEVEADTTRTTVIELLNRTRENADIRVLEGIIRRDPLLTFRLLRYINSPGVGMTAKISSIAQALMVLGYDQLYRWLTLLLFSRAGRGKHGGAFVTNALARGRLAELLGQDKLSRPTRDSLFITGVFSMLDILLGVPLPQALESIHLSAEVEAALLRREGPLAPYLELALASEQGWHERVVEIAQSCGIDAVTVNAAHVASLIWAESIVQ